MEFERLEVKFALGPSNCPMFTILCPHTNLQLYELKKHSSQSFNQQTYFNINEERIKQRQQSL